MSKLIMKPVATVSQRLRIAVEKKEIDFKNNLYKKIAQDMDLLKTISQYYNLPEEKQKTIRDLVDQMSR